MHTANKNLVNVGQKRAEEIIQKFASLSTWEERYRKIIAIGKAQPPLDTKYKTKDRLIKGCQSEVWLMACLKKGEVIFQSDSTALITKGLSALLVLYYSKRTPKEIIQDPIPSFFQTLKLQNHLTPTRVGGLVSMTRQIHYYAHGFLILSEKKS